MNQAVTVSELRKISEQTMAENGFQTEFPPVVFEELKSLENKPLSTDSNIKDLRNLLWSSIDNDSSKDLDQIEVAEELLNGECQAVYITNAEVGLK